MNIPSRSITVDSDLATFAVSQSDLSQLHRSIDKYGFGSLPRGILPNALTTLRAEAAALSVNAQLAEQHGPLSYKARVASLGPHAQAWLSKAADELLPEVFAGSFRLTPNRSCLTFYGPSCQIGPHVDRPAAVCSVTIIVYLAVTHACCTSARGGLVLKVFSDDPNNSGRCVLRIPTRVGTLVLGRGSQVWHERPALLPGESVVAITGCFQQRSPVGDRDAIHRISH